MPIGKYSHNRLATSSVDDDFIEEQESVEVSSFNYQVTHIGSEMISVVTQVGLVVEKLYSQNSSLFRSILNTNKVQLMIDKYGIDVLVKNKKNDKSKRFNVNEIISVSKDSKQDHLVVLVSKTSNNLFVDVYSCNNDKTADQIVQDCMKYFEICSGVDSFKYGSFPLMVEVIHSCSANAFSINESPSLNVKSDMFQNCKLKNGDEPDTSEFGDFQSVQSCNFSKDNCDGAPKSFDSRFEILNPSESQNQNSELSVFDEYDIFKERPPSNIFNPYTKISINEDLI
ncbi:uncharacterized protein LOC105849062 [Hydra vulgaris]|uniref:Uncharacterized protein LOC105849062 n=1 Tax=Hydra vulgaris TaxID=6087 RepID=A0ABM4D8H6_HYDVU